MWCIGVITKEYRLRMYALLKLYAKPYNPLYPVVCIDEKSKQLLAHSRTAIAAKQGSARKEDYEYKRNGTRNLFLTVEPKAGYRTVRVTSHRTREDFAKEMERVICLPRYKSAQNIHIVLDNLNTHFKKSFVETFGKQKARRILSRITFHHTPKHASWLNMAEIELSALERQCLKKRMEDEAMLIRETDAWEKKRNHAETKIRWTFTKQDADEKLWKHYVA